MNKRRDSFHPRTWSYAGLLLAAALLTSSSAHALEYVNEYEFRSRFMIALDVDFATTFSSVWIGAGGGAAVRVGSQINFNFVTLIPELVLGYHGFDCFNFNDARLFSGQIGSRLRFLKWVEPGIYSHLGVGRLVGDLIFESFGVVFDIGATLDLTVLRINDTGIDIGFHVAWNRFFGGYDSGFSYLLGGAHVALVF